MRLCPTNVSQGKFFMEIVPVVEKIMAGLARRSGPASSGVSLRRQPAGKGIYGIGFPVHQASKLRLKTYSGS